MGELYVEYCKDKMSITKSSLLLCFLSFLQISSCCKKTPEDMKPTTLPHPRDLETTLLAKESTTFNSLSTETPKPTTTTTTTTTETPFILQINDATITNGSKLTLRWNNGVNMTIPLTKTDDLFCNYEGVMPWDMSSSVEVTNGYGCNDGSLVVIDSEIYGHRMLYL